MGSLNVVFGISNTLLGLIMVGICYPFLKDRIPMNSWYGVRLSKSFQSKEAWYAINRYGAGRMIRWSLVLIVLGITAFFLTVKPGELSFWGLLLAPLILLVPCVEVWVYARKL